MTLLRKGLGEELTEIAETDDGDFKCGERWSGLGSRLGESK